MFCPSCGRENPEGFRFCGFCTAPLNREVGSITERKVVSVLFCDVVGFTAASERMDPEDVRARMELYYGRVRAAIESFGGTVEKFIGDAVMAVFGAPVVHEDDAERAVRAGLRMVQAVGELNSHEPGLELSVRVGVNTGEVVVALGQLADGSGALVLGDVVNTAARIQAAAPVDRVAVSETTHARTLQAFVYEQLPAATGKGKAEPLRLWRAVEPRTRFGSYFDRPSVSPFVGRHEEQKLLEEILERCVRDSSTHLVTLVGEPGAGKSRLIEELRAFTEERSGLVRWRQGRCLPYGEGITFWALGEILKAHAGIYESDSPESAAEKLEATLPDVEEKPWLRARLLPLVGVDSGQLAAQDESFTAWRRMLEHIAADGPAVVVIEDLHWADPALLEFLAYFAASANGVPLLMLCTTRPEFFDRNGAWEAEGSKVQTIRLAPLSESETGRLIQELTDGLASEPLQRRILERAGGNPLYAEELVRLVSERALTDDPPALPDSLHSLIAARLDLLTPAHKSVLQDAAVIGHVFWAGALRQMGDRGEHEVDVALQELLRKELIRSSERSSMERDAEYSFWHVLVRDVAYGQIPRADRARGHRAAATWIEHKANRRIEDVAEVLAHHYLQALDLAQATGNLEQVAELAPQARRFLALAGERALGLDTQQAEARLAHALELTPEGDPERPRLLMRWADAAFQAGRNREAVGALDAALSELRANGDDEGTALALLLLARTVWTLGEPRHIDLAAEAVSLLEAFEPGPALVDALSTLSSSQRSVGARSEAVATADAALTLAARLGLPEPANALADRGIARAELGEQEGIAELERALALWVEQGAGRGAAVAMNNLAYLRYPLEGHAASLAALEEGLVFAQSRGLAEAAMVFEGNMLEAMAARGRSEEALELAARLAAVADEGGDIYSLAAIRSVEVTVLAERGEFERALEHTDWLVETVRASGMIEPLVQGLAAAAIASGAAGDHENARALLVELEGTPGARDNLNYPSYLPALVRTALAASDLELARRLVVGVDPDYPLQTNALRSCRAQLAEAASDRRAAASLYAKAAECWQRFGDVREHAQALFGQARCLHLLRDPAAREPLKDARDLFVSMGYAPALRKIEALLESAELSATEDVADAANIEVS